MSLFPGFFGYDDPEDPSNMMSRENPWQVPSFLPNKTDSTGPAQDLTTTADYNIDTPAEKPPAINSFLPPSQEMQGYAPGNLVDIIHNAGQKYNVPDDILTGVANRESGFDPTAVGKSGEQGMFQLLPSTAKDVTGSDYNPFDIQQNVNAGAKYLGQQIDRFGQDKGIAAYNAGPDNVSKGIIPSSTEDYVRGVKAYADKVPNDLPSSALTADSRVPGSTATDVGGKAAASTAPMGGTSGQTTTALNGTNAGAEVQDARQRAIDALVGQSSDYEKKAQDARKGALESSPISHGQMFANIGVPLLSTVIGAALRGKKGALIGATAGFTGDEAGMKSEAKQVEDKQKLSLSEAQYNDKAAQDTRNKAIDLQKQDFGADDRLKIAATGGGRPSNQPLTQGDYEYWASKLGLSVGELAKTATTNGDIDRMLREKDIMQSSKNLKDRQAFSQERGKVFGALPIPGYENLSDGQKKNAGDIKAYTNSMLGALGDLRKSYQETGQVFMGADRAEQQANASVLWSAARNLLKTGMRLEGKEQELVNGLATPQFDLDGITGVLKNAFLKDGADETAARLEKVIKRDAASKLEANSQYAPEYLEFHSPSVLAAIGNKKTEPDSQGTTTGKAAVLPTGRPVPKDYASGPAYVAAVKQWEATNGH